jgi:hypothetical protein
MAIAESEKLRKQWRIIAPKGGVRPVRRGFRSVPTMKFQGSEHITPWRGEMAGAPRKPGVSGLSSQLHASLE